MDGMSQDTHWYRRMGIPTNNNNDQIPSGPQRASFPPPPLPPGGGDRRHHHLLNNNNNNNNNNGYINHPEIPPHQLSLQQQQPPPLPPPPTPNEDANAPFPPPNLPQFYPPPPPPPPSHQANSHPPFVHPHPPPSTNQFNQPPPGYPPTPFYPATVSSNPQQFFPPFPNGHNAQDYQHLGRPPRPGSFGYSMPNGGFLVYDSLPGQPELSQGPYYSIWKPDRLIQYNSDITYPTTIFPNPHQYPNPQTASTSSSGASNNYYGHNNNSNKNFSNNNRNHQNNRSAAGSNANVAGYNHNNNRRPGSNNSFRGRPGAGPGRGPGRAALRRLKHNDVIDLTDDCDETSNNATSAAGPSSSSSSSAAARTTAPKSSPPRVIPNPEPSTVSASVERALKKGDGTNSASLNDEAKESTVESLEIVKKLSADEVRADLQKQTAHYLIKNGLTNFFRLLYELSPVDEFRIIALDYLDCMDAYLFPRPSSIRELCFIIRKFVQTFKRFVKCQMYEYIIMEFFHYNMKIFSTCIEYCPFFKNADRTQYLTEIMEGFRIYFTSIETYLVELDKGVEKVMREKPKLSALAANQKYLQKSNSLNWEKPDPEFLYLKRGRPGPMKLAQRLISLLMKLSLGRLDCIYTILLKTMLRSGGKNTSVFYETVYRHFLLTIPKIVALNRPLTELDRYRLFCVWKFFTGKVRGKSRDTMNEALRRQYGSESKFAGNNQMILRCLDRYLADLEKYGSSFARDYFEIFEDATRELLDSNDTVTIISKFSWLSVDVEDHHSIVSLEQINRRVQLRRNYYEFTGKSVNNEELTSPHFLHRNIPHIVVYYPQIHKQENDGISSSSKEENKLVDGNKLYFIPDCHLYIKTKLPKEQDSKILSINDSVTISTFNFNNSNAELSLEEFNEDSWELIDEIGMINLASESAMDNEEITSWESWMELPMMEINSSPKLIEMDTLKSSQEEIPIQISSENVDDDLMMTESKQIPAVAEETSENVLKDSEPMEVSLEITEDDVLVEEEDSLAIDPVEQICEAKKDLNMDSTPQQQVEEIQVDLVETVEPLVAKETEIEKVPLMEQEAEKNPQIEEIQPIISNDIIEPVKEEETEIEKPSCVEQNVNDKIVQTEEVPENITETILEEFLIPLAPAKMDEKHNKDKPKVLVSINKEILKIPSNSSDLNFALLNIEKPSSCSEFEESFQQNVVELITEEKMIKPVEETPAFVEQPRKVRKRPKRSHDIKNKRSKKSKPNKTMSTPVTTFEPILQQEIEEQLEEEKNVVSSNQQKGLVVLEQVIIKPVEEKAKSTPESHIILEPINLINHQEQPQNKEFEEEEEEEVIGLNDSKSLMPSSLQNALSLKPVLFEEPPVDLPNNLTTPVNLEINKKSIDNIDTFASYEEWDKTVMSVSSQMSENKPISTKLFEVSETANNDLIEEDFEENSSGSIPSPQKEPLESPAELREYFAAPKIQEVRQTDVPLSFGINSILSSSCSIATSSSSSSTTPDHLRRTTPILIPSSSFDQQMLHHQSDINAVVESASIITQQQQQQQQPVKEFYESIGKEVQQQQQQVVSSGGEFSRNFINLVSPGVDTNDAISLQCRMMVVKEEEEQPGPLISPNNTNNNGNKLMHSPLSYQQYEVIPPMIKPITAPARNVTFFDQKVAEHHFNSYNKAIRENAALRRSSRVKPSPIVADNMHESYSNRRNVAENLQTQDFITNQQHNIAHHHHHHGVVQRSILKKPKSVIGRDQIGLKELYSDCPTIDGEFKSLDYNNLTTSSLKTNNNNNNLIINNSPEIAVRDNTNRFYQNNNLISNNLHQQQQQETQYHQNSIYDTNLPTILQLQREEYEEEERKLIINNNKNYYNNLYNNNNSGDSLNNIPNNNLVVEEPPMTTTTTIMMSSATTNNNDNYSNNSLNHNNDMIEPTYFTHNTTTKRPLIKNPKYSPNQELFMAAKAQLPPKKRKLTEDEELAILIEKIKEEQREHHYHHHQHQQQSILVNNPKIINEETVSYPAQRQMSIADLDEAFPKVRTLAAKKIYPEFALNNDDSLNSLAYPEEERYYNEYSQCDDHHNVDQQQQQQQQQINNKIMIGTFISSNRHGGVVECCSAEYPLCVMIDTMNPCVHHHHHHHISTSSSSSTDEIRKTVVLPSSSSSPPPVQNLTAQRRKSTRKSVAVAAAASANNKLEPTSSSVLQQPSTIKRGRGRPRKNPPLLG